MYNYGISNHLYHQIAEIVRYGTPIPFGKVKLHVAQYLREIPNYRANMQSTVVRSQPGIQEQGVMQFTGNQEKVLIGNKILKTVIHLS